MKNTLFGLFILTTTVIAQGQSSLDEKRSVAIRGGYGQYTPALFGTGFNYSMGARSSFSYGADLNLPVQDTTAISQLRFEKTRADFSAPSGASPSSISMVRDEYSFLFSLAPWDSGRYENLRVGVGYAFLSSGGTKTSPYETLSQQTSQGPIFNTTYKFDPVEDLTVEGRFLLYLPHRVTESSQATGQNPSAIGVELEAAAEYPVTKDFVGTFGIKYRLDRVTYDGSATRGITGGRDSRTNITAPIGLKFSF